MTRAPSHREKIQVALAPQAAPADVVIVYWGLRDRPLVAYGLLGITLLVGLLASMLSPAPLLALIASSALLLAAWRIWLPLQWELGLSGITESFLWHRRRIPWISIGKYEIIEDGVWIYADRESNAERGLFLEFGSQRAAVVGCIEYYLGTWTATGETSTLAHVVVPTTSSLSAD